MNYSANISLRSKLIFIIITVTLFSIVLGLGFVVFKDVQNFKNELISNTRIDARLIGQFCIGPLEFGFNDKVQEILYQYEGLIKAKQIIVYNSQGKIVAFVNQIDTISFKTPLKYSYFAIKNNYIHAFEPVFYKNEYLGCVHISTSLEPLNRKIKDYLFTMSFLFAGILLFSFLLAWMFQKIISNPILKLAKTVQVISEKGDYSIRVNSKLKDEVGVLYSEFNNLLAQIQNWQKEQQKAANALKESQLTFSLFMDKFPAIAIIKDESFRYVFVNQFLRDNFDAQNWIGKTVFEIYDEEIAGKIHRTDILAQQQSISFEELMYDKYKIPRYFEIWKFPIDTTGTTSLIGTIAIEITERIEAEKQISFFIQELVRNNQELEEFNYVASHDLREPLRTITNYCDLLKSDIGENISPEVDEDLKFITEASNRMNNLIQDLLALSRAGRVDLKQEIVSLNDCVKQAIIDLKVVIEESGGKIIYNNLPSVEGDRLQLNLVFLNLLSNALKFRNKNSPVINIWHVSDSKDVTICVEDNGIGIEPQYQEIIFAPFKRLHAYEKYDGTGIGLAICKKIINRHKGDVWVQSEPDNGSRFFIRFPKLN